MNNKQKVLVLGAGGIIGQHLLVGCPDWVDGIFTRRNPTGGPWTAFDAERDDTLAFLDAVQADVIVNLAGENRVDIVEAEPARYHMTNVRLPQLLARWTAKNRRHLIQCSSQGIFSGDNPVYSPSDIPHPLTQYGKQKVLSEEAALAIEHAEVVRFTFVLGIRPFQEIGRRNPLEDMIEKERQLQVDDRFFSPLFARDCAELLWELVGNRRAAKERIVHMGCPLRCSRHSIASDIKRILRQHIAPNIQAVSHDYFSGIAPRPADTTWSAERCLYKSSYEEGLRACASDWCRLKGLPFGG